MFFFSSRRRHTRLRRDWSSDVCSSDLLWQAIENPDTAADLTSVLCLVGSVFAVLSRYAVNFWNQGLHQGASLSLDAEENISDVFWQPLVLTMVGFGLLFVALVLIRTRTEIRARRLHVLEARERAA